MTWDDGEKYFFSTLFATPRMGPVGYILDSPYSPLRVERDIPSRNWRDAFEDLLAIDLNGKMIDTKDRKAEDASASKHRYDVATSTIQMVNHLVQKSLEGEKKWLDLRKRASKNRDTASVAQIDEQVLPNIRSNREEVIAEGSKAKANFEQFETATASSLKTRGQWIASLITSGALPGWQWATRNSVAGPIMNFRRRDASPELDAGIQLSELELAQVFENGQPHAFGSPEALPQEPIQALANGSVTAREPPGGDNMARTFWPSPSSILLQRAETVKLSDTSSDLKVIIHNHLLNGKVVTKEFVRQPGKVLEEVENARLSMDHLRTFVMESWKFNSANQSDITTDT
ncbi:MAG: hypothetical protein Q9166_007116 [cf. Caloplaca sp. 2 TL-2023]